MIISCYNRLDFHETTRLSYFINFDVIFYTVCQRIKKGVVFALLRAIVVRVYSLLYQN